MQTFEGHRQKQNSQAVIHLLYCTAMRKYVCGSVFKQSSSPYNREQSSKVSKRIQMTAEWIHVRTGMSVFRINQHDVITQHLF